MVQANLVSLPRQQEVTPAGHKRAAVNIRTPRRQGASADKRVKIDPLLGKICECKGGAADSRRAVCVHVRVECHLTGEFHVETPVLVMIGPRRQPPNDPHLLTIEESGPLSAEKGAGQIGRCEIVFGSRVGSEGSALYTCRHATLDVDDAWPFEKQRIARERRVI